MYEGEILCLFTVTFGQNSPTFEYQSGLLLGALQYIFLKSLTNTLHAHRKPASVETGVQANSQLTL